jgi:hypothetical protein
MECGKIKFVAGCELWEKEKDNKEGLAGKK